MLSVGCRPSTIPARGGHYQQVRDTTPTFGLCFVGRGACRRLAGKERSFDMIDRRP